MCTANLNTGCDEQQPHLLLVDDDIDQLRLLIELLREKPYRLSIALDGMQGYNLAVSTQPELILLDVRMPIIDGFALCRRLKANSMTADIPVIFLSSAGSLDNKLMGLAGGAVDYILKPYAPNEVAARIKIHLALSGKTAVEPIAAKTGEQVDEDGVLVCAAQQELRSYLSTTPRLADIANKLNVNERKISRAFRKTLDMTPFEYLRQERMQEACRLLIQTSLSIVVISQKVGFSSAANFSTAFREYTGMAPTDYRREYFA